MCAWSYQSVLLRRGWPVVRVRLDQLDDAFQTGRPIVIDVNAVDLDQRAYCLLVLYGGVSVAVASHHERLVQPFLFHKGLEVRPQPKRIGDPMQGIIRPVQRLAAICTAHFCFGDVRW